MLLHGFPQTHLMWRDVAADLAADHTVICPDLRGYGASDKPADGYDKRTMAADIVALATALGHERFALAGHDRGALVAFRAGLDHPDAITRLTCLDVLPTLDMWDVLHGTTAAVGFHLYLMAQPPGLPERMIEASADAFFGHFLDAWGKSPLPAGRARRLPAGQPRRRAEHRRRLSRLGRASTSPTTRPTATPATGSPMPVTVLQQDWGAALGYDAARPLAGLGARARPPDRAVGPLHGRGGARRGRRGAASGHVVRPGQREELPVRARLLDHPRDATGRAVRRS